MALNGILGRPVNNIGLFLCKISICIKGKLQYRNNGTPLHFPILP